MDVLNISPGKNTPEIILNPQGTILIKGRSIHEDVGVFFEPVEKWVNEYIKAPADLTCIDMNLEYFNSASAKTFIHILQKLTHVTLKHKRILFNWYYEEGDDDILERGQYFASVLNTRFNFIKLKLTE